MFLDPSGLSGGAIDAPLSFAGVTNATSYEIEISRSTTLAGTYTVVGLGGVTNNLEHRHICNPNYFYKARVRARNAYGQPGTWTSLSTAVQPAAKSGAPADPTNIVTVFDSLSYGVKWDVPTEADYAYSEVYVNSGNVGPTISTVPTFTLRTGNLQLGFAQRPNIFIPLISQIWVWVRHVNRSGVKSNWVASASNGSVTTLGIDSSLLSSTAVSDKMAAAAVGSKGSYAFLKYTAATTLTPGDTTAGSNLAYTDSSLTNGSSPSGTWQCVGRCPQNQASMFLRIS